MVVQKGGQYIWRPHIFDCIFKTSEPIFMIFGTFQRRFILSKSVDSEFIKQSGTT